MKQRYRLPLSLAVFFAVLWSVPLLRAGFLLATAAAGPSWRPGPFDHDVGVDLLTSYALSLAAGWALAALLTRTRPALLLVPILLAGYAVGRAWSLDLDPPLLAVPAMNPWLPAVLSLFALILGFGLYEADRLYRQHRQP